MSDAPRRSRLPDTHAVSRPQVVGLEGELSELHSAASEVLFHWHFIRQHMNLHSSSPISQAFGRLANIVRPTDPRLNYHLKPGPTTDKGPTVVMETELTELGEKHA